MEHQHHHDHESGSGHLARSPAELKHPAHGSFEGHLVPGVMFIAWSLYWLWSIVDIHLRVRAAGPRRHPARAARGAAATLPPAAPAGRLGSPAAGRQGPFRSRTWYPWPYWPAPQVEPLCKVALPLLGVLIELYFGWGGWRPMFAEDGHFAAFHINNWQHALMYSGVCVSGAVDLIGFYTPLPPGTEQGFLAVAFLVETLLMGMHSKPNELDQLVHTLLTWVMVACVAACAAEVAAPRSLLLALLRAMLVCLQGTWFIHVGAIMFRDSMAWDMEDMGAVMFAPIAFGVHLLVIPLGTLSMYLLMRWAYARCGITSGGAAPGAPGGPAAYVALGAADADVLLDGGAEEDAVLLELAECGGGGGGGGGGGVAADAPKRLPRKGAPAGGA